MASRVSPGRVLACIALGLLGCSSAASEPVLHVDVKTDYVPGDDFDGIRVEIGSGDLAPRVEQFVDLRADYVRGRRVASASVSEGTIEVVVSMVDDGNVLASRVASVEVGRGVTVATVVITRNCRGVMCPAPGGDSLLRSCYGGRCADPRCTMETPEFCPVLCLSDNECAGSGCFEGSCEAGVCFSVARDGACSSGERCRSDGLCVPEGDAGAPDSSVPDASVPDVPGACPCSARQVCVRGMCETDEDGDGFSPPEDCDDENRLVNPSVVEVCGGVDDDCDLLVDESDVCAGCDAWVEGGRTYLLCAERVTWQAAVDLCNARGMNSAVIDDVAENAQVAAQISARLGDRAWIGLNDIAEEGEYVWESGAGTVYRNWDGYEPDNADNIEDCVAVRPDGPWNDQPCSATRMVLCESR